ncbi:MAG TPA: TetR/AcrR family transcriptional regulator [Noviherbaspirillum sp.]|jgi:AcrR family transcriptional regulator|uniref:TetR/AcrR family transcriptional regulator n=1 Tax=Noviherbaspirillum sp. TaxID=1926288 RepID=UPI002F959E3B
MQIFPTGDQRSRRKVDKRREIALYTLTALAELGFAHVNLREVAARSGARLGSIHYYFKDKTDLLVCAVRLYKDAFIHELEQLICRAETPQALIEQGSAALGQAIEEQADVHRLWYDVRAQAMFDPAFRPLVEELESKLVELTARFLDRLQEFGMKGVPTDALATYLLMDGWFRYCLQRHLGGDTASCSELVRRLRQMMEAAHPD